MGSFLFIYGRYLSKFKPRKVEISIIINELHLGSLAKESKNGAIFKPNFNKKIGGVMSPPVMDQDLSISPTE